MLFLVFGMEEFLAFVMEEGANGILVGMILLQLLHAAILLGVEAIIVLFLLIRMEEGDNGIPAGMFMVSKRVAVCGLTLLIPVGLQTSEWG